MNNENDDLQDGIGNTEGATGRWMHMANGKVVERVKEGTPGAITRTTKTGKVVHEIISSNITGRIEAIRNNERTVNYGQGDKQKLSTIVAMKVGDELINIDLDHSDRYWPMFVSALPNIKRDKKVRLEPYKYIPKGSIVEKIGLSVRQAPQDDWTAKGIKVERDGTMRVPWRWTKEAPGKLPPADVMKNAKGEPILKDGKMIYDFSLRDTFLRDVVNFFSDKLKEERSAELNELEQAGATTATPEPAPKPTPVSAPANAASPAQAAQAVSDDLDDRLGDEPPFADFGAGGSSEKDDSLPF